MKKICLIFGFFLLSIFYFQQNNLVFAQNLPEECDPGYVSSERDPRPAECNLCDTNDPLTPSCASSFEVFDEISYPKDGPQIIEKDWSGVVTLDPTQIYIPFVGKKNKEGETLWETINPFDTVDENDKSRGQFWEVSNASENDYITDYLEGTNEYYRNYGNQTTITDYQGVLRKLTPFEYQNQLKNDLIDRAESGEVHNYKIKYIERICWDTPFWMDAGRLIFNYISSIFTNPIDSILDKTINQILAESIDFEIQIPDVGHYCIYASMQEGAVGWTLVKGNKILGFLPGVNDFKEFLIDLNKLPGTIKIDDLEGVEANLTQLAMEDGDPVYPYRYPPSPEEENYIDKFNAWKEKDDGKWYRLWQAMPMLTREDSQGEIIPYLAYENDEDNFEIINEETAKIEAVPHLARLYEASQQVNNIFNVAGREWEIEKTEEVAQTNPPDACFKENYYLVGEEDGDYLCCGEIDSLLTAHEEFENPYYPCTNEATGSSCYGNDEKEVSRALGVNLQHPYLDEIWAYTTAATNGFFNIFRPHEKEQFEDIDAADIISYKYNPLGIEQNGEVAPEEGFFFFPHLKGIQEAREWVVNKALRPFVN